MKVASLNTWLKMNAIAMQTDYFVQFDIRAMLHWVRVIDPSYYSITPQRMKYPVLSDVSKVYDYSSCWSCMIRANIY